MSLCAARVHLQVTTPLNSPLLGAENDSLYPDIFRQHLGDSVNLMHHIKQGMVDAIAQLLRQTLALLFLDVQ